MEHKDRMKALGTEWSKLSDKQKEKYIKIAADDKVRFERETKELETKGFFITADGVKSTTIKPELSMFPKETVFPKKPMAAYFHYSVENGKKIREANKEIKITEVGKLVKEQWD